MTSPLVIREADPRDAAWDHLVRQFANRRVTHLSSWLGALAAAQCGTPLALVFEKDGEPVGCLPGLVASMGPWKMFGSPRAGWQTVSLGPVFDPARVTTAELMAAALPHLEREHGVAHVEIMHPGLDAEAMRAAGFRGAPVFTYRAALHPDDPERTLRQFKDSARRNVNRARRLGIEVTFVDVPDDAFVAEHYDQLREVFTRNGAAIPLSRQRMQLTLANLAKSGNLIAVRATLPGGRIPIATGTFFVEGNELVLWQWTHRDHYRWYRATELMTWTVLQRAMAMGCTTFDFMGGGEFKTRLGGEPDVTKMRWLRSRPRWLLAARSAAGSAYYAQQAVRGRVRRGAAALRQRLARRPAERPAAVVIGDADLVRALQLAGIAATVVAPAGSAAQYARSVTGSLPWIDPVQAPESLVEQLVAHGQAQSEPPVLFYEDDASLRFVSRYRDRLRQAFRFVVPDAQLLENLEDKGRFQQLAHRLRLPVAPAMILDPARIAAPDAEGIAFPAIVKPLHKSPRWMPVSGGRKAMLVETPEALDALWPRIAVTGLEVLLQSLVPGGEDRVESYHVYVDERGATVAEFTGRKIRTWPLEYGDSAALMISDAPDVAAVGREVVRKLKLRGLAKLDFKRAPDGTLVLLEVNARCTLWLHLAAAAGLNIPALVYADLLGLPRPEARPARAGATWCKPWLDWKAARHSGVSLVRWLAWVSRCDAISAFAWDDPMPLVGAGFGRLGPRRIAATVPARNAGLVEETVATR